MGARLQLQQQEGNGENKGQHLEFRPLRTHVWRQCRHPWPAATIDSDVTRR